MQFKNWLLNESRGMRLSPELIKAIDDNLDYITSKATKLQNFKVDIGPFKNPDITKKNLEELKKYKEYLAIPYSIVEKFLPILENAPNHLITITGRYIPEDKLFGSGSIKSRWQSFKTNMQKLTGAGGWASTQEEKLLAKDNPALQKDLPNLKKLAEKDYQKIKDIVQNHPYENKAIRIHNDDEFKKDLQKNIPPYKGIGEEADNLFDKLKDREKVASIIQQKYGYPAEYILTFGFHKHPDPQNPNYQKEVESDFETKKIVAADLRRLELNNAGHNFSQEMLQSLDSFEKFFNGAIMPIIEKFYALRICDVAVNKYTMRGQNKVQIRTLLVHEIIHCMDKLHSIGGNIQRYQMDKNNDYDSKIGTPSYYDDKAEVEAHIGQIVQEILDIPQKTTNPEQAKQMLDKISNQLKNPKLISSDKDQNNPLVLFKHKFDQYYSNLNDQRKRLLLKRLDRAVQDAKDILSEKSL
jgi:hypothetical protein